MQIKSVIVTTAAAAAAAIGGVAISNAANDDTKASTTTAAATQQASSGSNAQPPGQHDPSKGGHQANGKTETLLTGDTASKVKAAAEAKVSGGTVQRVETNVDSDSPYEAHIVKSDGTQVEVQVDKDFKVTAVNTMGAMGAR